MPEYYPIEIAGLKRQLPLFAVNNHLSIAAFILFGDVEITIAAAGALLERVPEFDVIVTPEAKSIPLAYEMSRQSGKPYVVVRKGMKVYMGKSIQVPVRSITTQKKQMLYLGQDDVQRIKGKRVLIVDDVISTGQSLEAVKKLVQNAGGMMVAQCAVLAEGDAQERDDIIYLAPLPLFEK